jgi:penicillin G amidase
MRAWLKIAVPASALAITLAAWGCSSSSNNGHGAGGSAGADGGPDANPDAPSDAPPDAPFNSPVTSISLTQTIQAPSLSQPVDVVRDEWGNPHIYGANVPDVAYAQGYIAAHDRLPELDFGRHAAAGTLAELGGVADQGLVDSDIVMRAWHLESTAQTGYNNLSASTAPEDKMLVKALGQYAAGVNAYVADLKAGKYSLPSALALVFSVKHFTPWTPVDSLLLGEYEAFTLAFDADSEIQETQLTATASQIFDNATNPALKARSGLGTDMSILSPVDPTYTISGWTGMNGDTSTASVKPSKQHWTADQIALLRADAKAVRDMGDDHLLHPSRGSNNWIIGPSLSADGHVLVANDPHLSLSNPPVWHVVQLNASGGIDPVDVMGVTFPGIPGVILGMNQHIAWGATVNNIDVTDVYQETVTPCSGAGSAPCVMFNGNKVPLTPRVEKIGVGYLGSISKTVSVTLYDVPQHGPIIPRPNATHDGIEPLGSTELSVKYTGFKSAALLRALFNIDIASTMQDAVKALDADFRYGGQNWVIGDDQGNFGWTETCEVPRRAAGHAPWMVLPGDGTAEWGADMDPRYIPHAYNPSKGFLATANADPIGVTDDGDPFFDEPVVGSSPLYLGWNYDPGTRVGRITKRIEAATQGGNKLTLDDLQSIQADAITEWGQALQPTLLDAATALSEEIQTSGSQPDLTALVAGASADSIQIEPTLVSLIQNWTFDTPAGVAEDNPTAQQIADSQAALISAAWMSNFAKDTLGDELAALGMTMDTDREMKLLVRACNDPTSLASGLSPTTGDPWIFDDLTTGNTETKQQIAAKALLEAIDQLVARLGADATQWRWGQVHTLTLNFFTTVPDLQIPLQSEYANGFPRHGDNGTVDVGNHGLSTTDFTYDAGPSMRFVCDLGPNGPTARDVIPGGEIFDPASPHYRDQMELWRKNQTYNLAFTTADVLASAQKELSKNNIGRIRFTP